MNDQWPWDQPPNCAVITEKDVIENNAPIVLVTHDADDHGWQFLGPGDDLKVEDARVVALSEVSELDPTVLEVARIAPGWRAWRRSPEHSWIMEPNPKDDKETD
jgi:hypothetical protein